MKKIVFILFLLLMPCMMINAACNETKHKDYVKYIDKITYDNQYIKASRTYTITIYNVLNGMYVMYGKTKYTPDSINIVTIKNVRQGTNVNLKIYGDDGCQQLREININELYYNEYFESNVCENYRNKIVICNSEYTTDLITYDTVKEVIDNYNNVIKQDDKKDDDANKEQLTWYERTKNFLFEYGIKILLVLLTCGVFIPIFNEKFRRVKHGI